MKEILDQTGDINGQATHRLLTLYEAPEFVKSAKSVDILGHPDLPPKCYADPITKQFPVHTKAACWVSMLFLLDNEDKLTRQKTAELVERINCAGSYHEVKPELDKLQSTVKTASADPLKRLSNSDFALIIRYDDGTVERHYPLRNALEVKAAAAYVKKFEDVIPYNERQKMAERIVDKAAEMGADVGHLSDYLEKVAGYGTCSASDVSALIQERVTELKRRRVGADYRTEMSKIASLCTDNPEYTRSRESLIKLAGIISNIDHLYGLHREYDRLARPEDVLFGITEKSAEQVLSDHCSTTTGNVYKIADFRKVPIKDLAEVFGDSFVNQVSAGGITVSPEKLAEEAATLPRPDAEILDRLLSKAGIFPTAKTASTHESTWFDKDHLSEVASHRKR